MNNFLGDVNDLLGPAESCAMCLALAISSAVGVYAS